MTIHRKDMDGAADRPAVYALLGSFDGQGLDASAFEAAALRLFALPDVVDAAGLMAAHVPCLARATAIRATAAAEAATTAEAAATAGSAGVSGTAAAATGTHRQAPEDILAHRFSFYDEMHQLPELIDWEHNPGTGHWAHDLNRFSYLATLSSGWQKTGDARYARKAVDLILAWIDATDVCDAFPPGRSPYVWRSYLNIAIHLEAWSTCLSTLLGELPTLMTPAEFLRIAKSVHDQLAYLDFVIPEMRNNWVTIGCRAQLVTFAHFACFANAPALVQRAWERLDDAIDDQVLPDGAQDELTPGYHGVVVRNLLNSRRYAPCLPVPMPPSLDTALARMLAYLRHCITPDLQLVAFNDTDASGGAAALAEATGPVARELLGDAAVEAPLASTCFPYSGLMVQRQGSQFGADELFLAFDGGPFGRSHQHEDMLGFVLAAYGRTLIVDPGRHLYDTSAASYREFLSSTRAHSTILIDGQGQNARARPDTWRAREPLPLLWEVARDGGAVAGATYALGYGTGPEPIPVRHSRTIRFVPKPGAWIIEDHVEGTGEHLVESRLQFAPCGLAVEGHRAYTMHDDANLLVATRPIDWDTMTVEEGHEDPRAGWYSPRYGLLEPAPALVMRATRQLPFRARLVLFPYRGALPPMLPRGLMAALA